MGAHAADVDRSAILVVSGMRDIKLLQREVQTPPRMHVVIELDDVFARVIQFAVTEDEAEAAGASEELLTLRRRLLEEWYTWRNLVEETLLSEKRDKTGETNGEDADEIIEEWVEEVVEEKEEVVTD